MQFSIAIWTYIDTKGQTSFLLNEAVILFVILESFLET